MLFSNDPHIQRQKLVILERVKQDISRFTSPLFNVFAIAAAVYLPCYAHLMLFSSAGAMDPLNILLVLSAITLVLISPAFALAATVEVYFTRRIANISRRGLPDAAAH